MNSASRFSRHRPILPELTCPACQTVTGNADRCPTCQFTGADTLAMFPQTAPPLRPMREDGLLWDERDLKRIGRARRQAARRFPQFHWRVCSTALPPECNLRLYGFWLLNVSPLAPGETPTERSWSVLLVLNGSSHRAAAVTGYAAEPWLSADPCEVALRAIQHPWRTGQPGKAVAAFITTACDQLETSWRAMPHR